MFMIDVKKRFEFLTQIIPQALQTELHPRIKPYAVISQAAREKVVKQLVVNTEPCTGLFPEDLSIQYEIDNVEPQLMQLTQASEAVFIAALADKNGAMVIYSHLGLEDLAKQLRPLVNVMDGEIDQPMFFAWWDARNLPPTLEVMGTPERKGAMLGNIHGFAWMDDLHEATLKLTLPTEEHLKIYDINEATNQFHLPVPQVIEYTPLVAPVVMHESEMNCFKNHRMNHQVHQITYLLAETDIAKSRGHSFEGLLQETRPIAKHAYFTLGITQRNVLYTYIKASYILGQYFERDTGLEKVLPDKNLSDSHKELAIDQYLEKQSA